MFRLKIYNKDGEEKESYPFYTVDHAIQYGYNHVGTGRFNLYDEDNKCGIYVGHVTDLDILTMDESIDMANREIDR